MRATTARISAFGKLPTHGDFVRHNAHAPALRALDEWVQRGLFLLKSRRPDELEGAREAARTAAFIFVPARAGETLAGVLTWSGDSAGRVFPFVIASSLPGEERLAGTGRLVTRSGPFFREAAQRAGAAAAGEVDHREIASFLEGLPTGEADEAPYRRYLQETTLATFAEQVWNYFEDSHKYVLFKHLTETFGSVHDGAPALRLALRFPLDRAAPTLCARFWMDACERAAGEPLRAASAFWEIDAEAEPALLLSFTAPAPELLGEVLGSGAVSERVWDLQAADGEQAALAALALPPGIGAVLEEETATLADLLDHLGE